MNGGAWLRVEGVAVDWILRDLDRVERVWADCREGRYEIGTQVGHPLGFWSPCYAGEVALGQVLADPTDTLYVALCLSRAIGVLVQGLFAHDRRWCLNEKGALAVAGTLPGAPRAFGPHAQVLLGALGGSVESLMTAVAQAREFVQDTLTSLNGHEADATA